MRRLVRGFVLERVGLGKGGEVRWEGCKKRREGRRTECVEFDASRGQTGETKYSRESVKESVFEDEGGSERWVVFTCHCSYLVGRPSFNTKWRLV